MAENGDNKGVDMLVSDIYGKGYDQMNLKGYILLIIYIYFIIYINVNIYFILIATMVASSFGKLVMAEDPRTGLKEEDLAIALLMMITNNIGQVIYQ